MAISYDLVSYRNEVHTLGLFGSARGIAKHLKIYINLIVPCSSCQIPALGTEEMWKTQNLKIFKR